MTPLDLIIFTAATLAPCVTIAVLITVVVVAAVKSPTKAPTRRDEGGR